MTRATLKHLLTAAGLCGVLLPLPASSHFDDQQMPQSYRQSYFALLASNFGPMAATVKGDIPWDQARMQSWADDLATLSKLDVMRGFADGSDKGTTRAKPEIWQNKEDFNDKLEAMRKELVTLKTVTTMGERTAISAQVAATGKACKSCHDDYKAENYLY